MLFDRDKILSLSCFTYTCTGGNDTALDQTMPGQFSSQDDVAVRLPPSLFERLRRRANVGVFFGRYEAATLFPVRGETVNSESSRRERVVCSNVVAATVGENMRLQNLEQPVTLALRLQNKSRVKLVQFTTSKILLILLSCL